MILVFVPELGETAGMQHPRGFILTAVICSECIRSKSQCDLFH
jgi:hypothetical protein